MVRKYIKHRLIIFSIFLVFVLSLGLGLGLGLQKSNFSNVKYNDKAFIISTSNEAYNKTKNDLSKTELDFQMFNAVKGSDITKSGLIKDKSIVSIKGLYDISVAEHRRAHSDLGTANAVGCYLSHVTLWQQLINDETNGYFIFRNRCSLCQ